MAEHIPGATYVELPGADHRPWLGDVDAIADEIEIFLTGRKSRPRRRTDVGVDALSRREREVAAPRFARADRGRDRGAPVPQQAHGREPSGDASTTSSASTPRPN